MGFESGVVVFVVLYFVLFRLSEPQFEINPTRSRLDRSRDQPGSRSYIVVVE